MKTIAIHQEGDWYLVNLSGLSYQKKERIAVEVTVTNDAYNCDYTELRSTMLMEKYLEKQSREILKPIPLELKIRFNTKFDIPEEFSMNDVINLIRNDF
jgi:hypothetical protein